MINMNILNRGAIVLRSPINPKLSSSYVVLRRKGAVYTGGRAIAMTKLY
jgi:hypothetical protein